MAAFPRITPPNSIGRALAPLADLTDEEFEALHKATSTARGFSLSAVQLKELSKQIPGLANQVTFVLGALSYLYGEVARLAELDKSYLESGYRDVIGRLIDDLQIGSSAVLQGRFEALLKQNPSHQRYLKIRRLQNGFLPNATSFRSFVDLRPDFGEGEAVDYTGLVNVIQFRVLTDSDNPADAEIVFQLSEESLAEMKKAIDRAFDKVRALRSEPRLSSQIIDIER